MQSGYHSIFISFIFLAGTPATIVYGSTSFVTTAPAPTTEITHYSRTIDALFTDNKRTILIISITDCLMIITRAFLQFSRCFFIKLSKPLLIIQLQAHCPLFLLNPNRSLDLGLNLTANVVIFNDIHKYFSIKVQKSVNLQIYTLLDVLPKTLILSPHSGRKRKKLLRASARNLNYLNYATVAYCVLRNKLPPLALAALVR